jgi:hypothetical protein
LIVKPLRGVSWSEGFDRIEEIGGSICVESNTAILVQKEVCEKEEIEEITVE